MNKRIREIGTRRITIFSDDDASSGAILYIHMASADDAQGRIAKGLKWLV